MNIRLLKDVQVSRGFYMPRGAIKQAYINEYGDIFMTNCKVWINDGDTRPLEEDEWEPVLTQGDIDSLLNS